MDSRNPLQRIGSDLTLTLTLIMNKALAITECKVCGSTDLTWQTSIVNRSNIQQGRLNTSDVECLFFLGCDHCSETLATVSADKVVSLMNESTNLNGVRHDHLLHP